MDTTSLNRIEAEREWLREFREDISVLAAAVAEDTVDALEGEIERETKNGFIWDLAEGLQTSLLMALSSAFEESVQDTVVRGLDAHSRQMAVALDASWSFDVDRAELDNLRKSLRLVQRVRPLIERLFTQAKPSVVTQIFRAIGNDIEDMAREWQNDGEILRQAFAKARALFQKELQRIAEELIQRLRLQYQQALDQITVG